MASYQTPTAAKLAGSRIGKWEFQVGDRDLQDDFGLEVFTWVRTDGFNTVTLTAQPHDDLIDFAICVSSPADHIFSIVLPTREFDETLVDYVSIVEDVLLATTLF